MKNKFAHFFLAAAIMTAALPQIPYDGGNTAENAYHVYAAEKLAAPKGLKASEKTESMIKLKWNKVSGADAYRVFIYDSEKGKYVTYKTVTGTSCTVKSLTAGTKYRFKTAALKKSGGKYSVQTLSSALSVKTKSASASSSSDKEPSEFDVPAAGTDRKTVLKECGIGEYTSKKESNGTSYTGTVLVAGVRSSISLLFNNDDKLAAFTLIVPMSEDDFDLMIASFTQSIGEEPEITLTEESQYPVYMWMPGNAYLSLEYPPDAGSMYMMSISFDYYTK